LRLAYGIIMLS